MTKSTPLSQLQRPPVQQQPEPVQQPEMPQNNLAPEEVQHDLVNEILTEIENTPGNDPMNIPQQQFDMGMPEQNPAQFVPSAPPAPEKELSLLDEYKEHLVIGVLVALLSVKPVTSKIRDLLPQKDFIVKHSQNIVALIKGIIAMAVSYAYKTFA